MGEIHRGEQLEGNVGAPDRIDDHTTDSRILTPRRARVRCKLQCGTHVDEPLCRRLEVIHALESSAIERSAVTMAAGSGAR